MFRLPWDWLVFPSCSFRSVVLEKSAPSLPLSCCQSGAGCLGICCLVPLTTVQQAVVSGGVLGLMIQSRCACYMPLRFRCFSADPNGPAGCVVYSLILPCPRRRSLYLVVGRAAHLPVTLCFFVVRTYGLCSCWARGPTSPILLCLVVVRTIYT